MTKEERKEYMKKWYEINKDKLKKKDKEYREANKEKIKKSIQKFRKENADIISARNKKYREKNKEIIDKKRQVNKNIADAYNKEYYQKNKQSIIIRNTDYSKKNRSIVNKRACEYIKERTLKDPLYKLTKNVRSLINNSLRNFGKKKNTKTEKILGCTFEEFKKRLEGEFKDWMSWDNYGKFNGTLNYGWDIDHIIPLDSAKTEDELIKLSHYKNLQPLCSYTNRHIKRNLI